MIDEIIRSIENREMCSDAIKHALLVRGEDMHILHQYARKKRDEFFKDKKVEVRSVIEISNICAQNCLYCNMGKDKEIKKYDLQKEEIINIVDYIYKIGRKVLLLQSGENYTQNYINKIADTVYEIKKNYGMTIILCIGSLDKMHYKQLRDAGADRYILKFETSNDKLFSYIKPGDSLKRRLKCLDDLISLNFDVGSGNITGLPGQTLEDIVNDIYLIDKYMLKMNSTTVFIPAEKSQFSKENHGDVDLALNLMAIMRIMNPTRLLPTTSSLEKIKKDGQLMGLNCGANTITIHDGTPDEIKKLFPIYSTERVVPNSQYFNNIVHKANMEM
jgi:biotin synthase